MGAPTALRSVKTPRRPDASTSLLIARAPREREDGSNKSEVFFELLFSKVFHDLQLYEVKKSTLEAKNILLFRFWPTLPFVPLRGPCAEQRAEALRRVGVLAKRVPPPA